MRNVILIVFLLLYNNVTYSQSSDMYFTHTRTADSLFNKNKYKEACKFYSLAFKLNNNMALIDDRYVAAESWSMIGEIDSAFYNLFKIAHIQEKYTVDIYQSNKFFDNLKKDNRWDSLIVITSKRKLKYNSKLSNTLDSILKLDQGIRSEYLNKRQKIEINSPEYNSLMESMRKIDSSNLKIVLEIINKHGWLGKDVVGYSGNLALFLVIQHSPTEIQEKVLPILEAAVKDKRASPNHLALLQDRISVNRTGKQIYGSQYYEKNSVRILYPLIDPINVNKRRMEVGLEPLEKYLESAKISMQ